MLKYLNRMLDFYVIQLWLSRIIGFFAHSNIKIIKNTLISLFLKFYPVDMTEAEEGDPFVYVTYNDFFTRKLKLTTRPIDPDENSLISPADCVLHSYGKIDTLIAKDKIFTVDNLCGKSDYSKFFTNGQQITCYLAPSFYHRVHLPLAGSLMHVTYIPGTLFSVSPSKLGFTNAIFAKNERVVMFFETKFGNMAVILVGATIVGNIKINHVPLIIPHLLAIEHYKCASIQLAKGSELGSFNLGSTVIVLLDHSITWNNLSGKIKMGQSLGVLGI